MPARPLCLAALLAALGAAPAAAQDWTVATDDNGAWFEARAASPDGTLGFRCGGRSAGGQPLPETDEPFLTDPWSVVLAVAVPGALDPAGFPEGRRDDLAIVAGTTGYRLPTAVWDELDGLGWLQVVAVNDPLIPAIMGAPLVAVDGAGGRLAVLRTDGAPLALGTLISFCVEKWQAADAAGVLYAPAAAPPPETPAAPPPAAAAAPPPTGLTEEALMAAVEARVAELCPGGAARAAGWLNRADLDADGTYDFVLDWGANACAGSDKAPGCTPFGCPIEVFLSARFGATGTPEAMSGKGVRIDPDGQGGLVVVTRDAFPCETARDPATCEFGFGWTGGAFRGLW